jgi:hypothetical protein
MRAFLVCQAVATLCWLSKASAFFASHPVGTLAATQRLPFCEARGLLWAGVGSGGKIKRSTNILMATKKASNKKKGGTVKPHIQVNTKIKGIKQLSKDPAIFTIENFFDKDTCERYLSLGTAGEASGDSLKVDSATFGGGLTAKNRQSTTWFLKYASAPELVKGALEVLPDRALQNCEEPQIVRYEMGDFFNWHEDALPIEEAEGNSANGGQRLATLLVYLNDVPTSGGEMHDMPTCKVYGEGA